MDLLIRQTREVCVDMEKAVAPSGTPAAGRSTALQSSKRLTGSSSNRSLGEAALHFRKSAASESEINPSSLCFIASGNEAVALNKHLRDASDSEDFSIYYQGVYRENGGKTESHSGTSLPVVKASGPGCQLSPLKSIRAKCIDCCTGSLGTVRHCDFKVECPLWDFRMGKGAKGKGGLMKPIRRYCLWCMRDQPMEVRLCPCAERCALYPYRLGRRPTTRPLLAEKTQRRAGVEARAAVTSTTVPISV